MYFLKYKTIPLSAGGNILAHWCGISLKENTFFFSETSEFLIRILMYAGKMYNSALWMEVNHLFSVGYNEFPYNTTLIGKTCSSHRRTILSVVFSCYQVSRSSFDLHLGLGKVLLLPNFIQLNLSTSKLLVWKSSYLLLFFLFLCLLFFFSVSSLWRLSLSNVFFLWMGEPWKLKEFKKKQKKKPLWSKDVTALFLFVFLLPAIRINFRFLAFLLFFPPGHIGDEKSCRWK